MAFAFLLRKEINWIHNSNREKVSLSLNKFKDKKPYEKNCDHKSLGTTMIRWSLKKTIVIDKLRMHFACYIFENWLVQKNVHFKNLANYFESEFFQIKNCNDYIIYMKKYARFTIESHIWVNLFVLVFFFEKNFYLKLLSGEVLRNETFSRDHSIIVVPESALIDSLHLQSA